MGCCNIGANVERNTAKLTILKGECLVRDTHMSLNVENLSEIFYWIEGNLAFLGMLVLSICTFQYYPVAAVTYIKVYLIPSLPIGLSKIFPLQVVN